MRYAHFSCDKQACVPEMVCQISFYGYNKRSDKPVVVDDDIELFSIRKLIENTSYYTTREIVEINNVS